MQFRTQRGNLLTAVERKTGLTLASGLAGKTAEATAAGLTDLFSGLPKAASRGGPVFDPAPLTPPAARS